MKLEAGGTSILEVEVTQIDKHGIWLLIGEKESFLPFEDFPWFRDASVGTIHNVELLNNNHLYWPGLDIDLALESIERSKEFPLTANANRVVIAVGLENLAEEADLAGLKRFLVDERGAFQTYSLAPAPRGVIRCAGFDLMLILGATASVASIASLLWTAYEKFIAAKRKSLQDDGAIHISIRRPDGTTFDIWIGRTHRERDIFIRDFSETANVIRVSDDPSFWLNAVAEIEEDEIWIRNK